jgi:hypothetical protein
LELQQSLEAAQTEIVNNNRAASILNEWQADGVVYQGDDGSVHLAQQRDGGQQMQQ